MSEMGMSSGGSTASASTSSTSATPSAGKGSSFGSQQGSQHAKATSQGQTPGQTAPKAEGKPGQVDKSWNPGGEQAPDTAQASAEVRELGDQDLDAVVKVKVNGEERKMSVREAIKLSQLEQASHEKLRQAAEERKRADVMVKEHQEKLQRYQQLENLMKSDFDKFAEMTGIDFDAIAEQRLAKKYELLTMTPEQRHAYEAEQRAIQAEQQLEQYRQIEMSSKSEVVSGIKEILGAEAPEGLERYPKEQLDQYLSQLNQSMESHRTSVQNEFIQSWDTTGLPKHPWFMAQAVSLMLREQKNGGKVLKTAEAADMVKADFMKFTGEVLGSMDAKAIRDLLGDAGLKKLKESEIERVSQERDSKIAQGQRPGNNPASGRQAKAPAPMNQQEYRKLMGIR